MILKNTGKLFLLVKYYSDFCFHFTKNKLIILRLYQFTRIMGNFGLLRLKYAKYADRLDLMERRKFCYKIMEY